MRIPERYNNVTQTRYGTLIYNKNDVRVGRSIELYGEYCERAIVVFDQMLSASQIVLDIGANVGAQTLFFAKKVGPEGSVLAFEPQRLVFQTLCGNMAINSITNVHCWNTAVGARQGQILVPRIDHERTIDLSAVEVGTAATGDRVPVIAIDDMNLPRCDVMRIAAPGMESAILQGAASLLGRVKPILYISCQLDPSREAELLQQILNLGLCVLLALRGAIQSAQLRGQSRKRLRQPNGPQLALHRQRHRTAIDRLHESRPAGGRLKSGRDLR